MYFIKDTDLNETLGVMMEAPGLIKLDENLKKQLKNVLLEYMKEIYINRPQMIENYMNYKIDDNYINTYLQQYGFENKYIEKINKSLKKIIAYFIEQLYQLKGSDKVLNIFGQIFMNIFGALNFYQVIVVKIPKVKEVDGQIIKEYVLTYSLKPLIINNSDKILTSFNQKVSLKGKHLMNLEQYADFNVFPAKTNLIFIQFTSAQSNINNFKVFEKAIKAYALTRLNMKTFEIKNFQNLPQFQLVGSDIEFILFFADILRIKKFENCKDCSEFDFNFKNKVGYDLIFPFEMLDTIEDILYRYSKINYANRKELDDIKRRWKFLINQNIKPNTTFTNFQELREYLHNRYSDLIDFIENLNSYDELIDFYIMFYDYILSQINFDDNYIVLYLNFIFLNVITGESFIDNFFIPVYNFFQKYFFPIEMDFLNKISNELVIKDKFEAFATTEDFHTLLHCKGWLEKWHEWPDAIKIKITYKLKNLLNQNDTIDVNILIKKVENLLKDEMFKMIIQNRYHDQYKIKDNLNCLIQSKFIDIKKISNYISTKILSKNKDKINNKINNIDKQNLKILIKSNDLTKIKSQNLTFVTTKNQDLTSINDTNKETLQRANYLQNYDDLNQYYIFQNEQYRRESAYLDNINYKLTYINDEIYYRIIDVF